MVFFQDSKCLTNFVIDEWSMQSEEAYRNAAGKRADSTLELRLALEELLLRFRDLYGTDEPCQIKGVRRFRGIYFELSQHGLARCPLDIDSGMDLSYDILSRLQINPSYAYREVRNLNVVTVPAPIKPRKNSMLIGILIAAVLSVATWLLADMMPGALWDNYLIPLISGMFKKMSAIFSALATPLVFLAVITGISGLGNVSAFGKLGSSLLKRMLITYGIAMGAMLVVGLPMGLVSYGKSTGGGNVFSDILTLVLNIIPDNLIEPFRIDNDLQVIVIAIFVGVIMLILGDKVHRIRLLVDEGGTLINRMMLVVCKLMPLFVYLGVTNMLLSDSLSRMSDVSKIIIISLTGGLITIGITIIRALIVTKQPFKWMFSAQLPALLINLTTSSQVSALPESMRCCKERWGIQDKFTDFGLPLGVVIYMPNGAIMLCSIVWVLASISSGAIDSVTLVKLIFVAVIVAIAAPPIPGSAFAVLPILFSACGTDLSLMPLAVIVASTVGYLLPAMNGFCLQLELLMAAWKNNCIDKERAQAARQ